MPKIGTTELAPALEWPKYFYQGFNRQYFRKVLSYRPIAYWPLWEASGSVAYDISGNGLHGAYTGVTLGQTGIGDGRSCPLFDGSTSIVDLYSAGFISAFNGAEGSLVLWFKVFDAGTWIDSTNRWTCKLRADASNLFQTYRSSVNNRFIGRRIAGGTVNSVLSNGNSSLDWISMALTWSEDADQLKFFQDGAQVGSTQTVIDTWVGTLHEEATLLGGEDTGGPNWYGWLAHAQVYDSVLSLSKITSLAVV